MITASKLNIIKSKAIKDATNKYQQIINDIENKLLEEASKCKSGVTIYLKQNVGKTIKNTFIGHSNTIHCDDERVLKLAIKNKFKESGIELEVVTDYPCDKIIFRW